MSAEFENDMFGAYDSIDYEGIDDLVNLIDVIKGLDDEAYRFVMRNIIRRLDN